MSSVGNTAGRVPPTRTIKKKSRATVKLGIDRYPSTTQSHK